MHISAHQAGLAIFHRQSHLHNFSTVIGYILRKEGAVSIQEMKNDQLDRQKKKLEMLIFKDARFEEALKVCDDILREHPGKPDIICLQGIAEFRLGHTKEAESLMEKALGIAPDSPDVLYHYAVMLMAQDKLTAALPLMMRAAALKPDHAQAHRHIGNMLRKTGNLAGAVASFNRALEADPEDGGVLTGTRKSLASAWNEKGILLEEAGCLPEASECYEHALTLDPGHHEFINNLGYNHFLRDHLDTAAALYRAALTVRPDYPEALSNLSVIMRLKGELDEALSYCGQALALSPEHPDSLNNLGNALKDAGRMEEAVAAYRKVLCLLPDSVEVHMNLALALLAQGLFDEGWREFEWRWRSNRFLDVFPDFEQPEWEGEDGKGKTLLIHSEQGFGDSLQFCRYTPLARQLGFRVIMAVPPQLERIMQSLDGIHQVVTTRESVPHHDLHIPMMSLPRIFRTTIETIPARLPYLSPDPADLAWWRDRVAYLPQDTLKVGLAWAGRSRACSADYVAMDQQRSIDPELLFPLMQVPGVQYFSLQKEGMGAPDSFPVIDWMADCHDFADTAALIMNLDLVISVDTAVVHLAGALGRPVWLLNRFNNCWRWLAGRTDSPWYPTLRIFRQKRLGNWHEVIMRVRAALSARSSLMQSMPGSPPFP